MLNYSKFALKQSLSDMALRKQFSNKNIEQFIVDSPEKAYVLGFLWGDGTVKSYKLSDGSISNNHYVEVEIVREDFEKIEKLFEVWGKWTKRFRKRIGRREQGILHIADGNFGWFLVQNDFEKKSISEPTKILSIIPNKYRCYWWRGFIDADGCFYAGNKTSQFSIAGNYELNWGETVKLFDELDIRKYQVQHRIHQKSKSSAIRISNKNSIIKLGEYLYQDKLHIGLRRKYEKLLLIKSSNK